VAVVVASLFSGSAGEAMATMRSLMAAGAAMFALGAARLPGWAKLRRRQMEGVAARLAMGEDAGARGELTAGHESE